MVLTRFAVCSFRIEGPVTYSLVFIKIKSGGASVFFSYTINTGIKDVADGWLGVSIKSVETWAKIICSLRLLCETKNGRLNIKGSV